MSSIAEAVIAVDRIETRAPAKLIISGEHSVVYGHPAIAIALDMYANSTVTHSDCLKKKLGFDFHNLRYNAKHTINTLKKLKNKAQIDYARFLNGECSIREVINKPFELLQFALSHFLDKLNITLPGGIDIKTNSDIPSGCGLGSSAATIMSLLYAVGNLLNLDISKNRYIELGRQAENLQHGKSSGLDLNLTVEGGCLKYHEGNYNKINFSVENLYLINTGRPVVTTGECVANAKKYFHNSDLGKDFADITLSLERELLANNIDNINLLIKENNKLLEYIGVVPSKVNKFINQLENAGSAAKICGSGSVSGDSAGVVMAVCPDIEKLKYLRNLCQFYNYNIRPINIDNNGIRVL